MRGVGDRVDRGKRETAKPGEAVVRGRKRPGVGVALQQLVHGVDDRRIEISLVRAEHAEGLVAVTEERSKGPGQLDAHEPEQQHPRSHEDRKSTRLNSSHVAISYAVFCLKKKTKKL